MKINRKCQLCCKNAYFIVTGESSTSIERLFLCNKHWEIIIKQKIDYDEQNRQLKKGILW